MAFQKGRYSWTLNPVLIIYDLIVINILAYFLLDLNSQKLYFFQSELFNNKNVLYLIYSTIFWISSAFLIKFYEVRRFTTAINLLSLLFKQFLAFLLIVYAFMGVFRSIDEQAQVTLAYMLYCFIAIGLVKFAGFYSLKAFRSRLKGNNRNVVIIGSGENINELLRTFDNKDLGYHLKGTFNRGSDDQRDGSIEDSFEFLENNQNIDEVYCAIDDISERELNRIVRISNLYHYNLKFISKTQRLFTNRLKTDYYGYLPVLSFQEGVLNSPFNKFVKRSFDILFSLIVITFVLSWLSIVLFILIRLESKGPLYYKHKRTGINYEEFNCYKFRSMVITKEIKGTYVQPDDARVTRIGKFLRKTSIDELPQFYNVLLGQMSVVGPRPHMLSYTEAYAKIVDKYNFMFRHNVRPGITGLAQIKGYRGEIKSDEDIINRVKYDIFYIENWSLLLDLKIIVQTIINVIKGEDKAY